MHDDHWPDITNLRVVGDRLLVGGQTSPDQYRELAERNVTLVIDMRTGGVADLSTDDPQQLTALGVNHAELPVTDGHVPTPAQVRRFLDLVATPMAVSSLTAVAVWVVPPPLPPPSRPPRARIPRPRAARHRASDHRTNLVRGHVAPEPSRPSHQPRVAVVSRLVDAPRGLYGWVKSVL